MIGSLLLLAALAGSPAEAPADAPADREPATLASVAVRVHRTDAMLGFYQQAFGFDFERIDHPGFTVYSGRLGGLELKLVPIRDDTDFEGFPVHQLGFTVDDLSRVIALAERHGGRLLEHREATAESAGSAAVRDPDGNSLELYSAP